MTVEAPPIPDEAVGTPRRGPRLGRIVAGIGGVAAFVLVIVVVFALTRTPERPVDYLSPESGSPAGARALVNVLGDQGVDVHPVTTLADARAVGGPAAETTLMLFDYAGVLGPEQHRALLDLAAHVVVMEAWDYELADLAPGVELVGPGSPGVKPADCGLPAVQRAGGIDSYPYVYDVAEAENPVTGCFEADDGVFAVVQTQTLGTTVTVVGDGGVFTNGSILEAGNAAFALNLLGEHETLIWYLPDVAEAEGGDARNPVTLTPPWLTPAIALLAVAGLAAAIWRGRRLGALVPEKLPVIVKANETMEGRARLYERAGARAHALDSLRIGAIARLATACGLPRRASVEQVVDAVAALTRRDRAAVAALLVDRVPAHDRDLIALSDDLLRLEADVARATRGH